MASRSNEILDNDGSKTFLNGTHRVTDPATTLARVMPLAARMGITRVAMVTGLDVLGIPVAAMRPNSRSIAVHQGKGLTRNSAKASALMEAVECYHAEVISLEMLHPSFAELPDAVDPAQLTRSRGRAYGGERLPWVAGSDLLSGRSLWLPHELVSADFAASMYMPTGLFHATTNGLASGNHWLEAVLHALYEVVERDAVALWRTRTDAPQNARALDPSAVDGKLGQLLLLSFAQAGVAVRIWT